MSNNQGQEVEMNGEDFSQDVKAGDDDQMNGGNDDHGDGGYQNGSSEAPGRDDDRLVQ